MFGLWLRGRGSLGDAEGRLRQERDSDEGKILSPGVNPFGASGEALQMCGPSFIYAEHTKILTIQTNVNQELKSDTKNQQLTGIKEAISRKLIS